MSRVGLTIAGVLLLLGQAVAGISVTPIILNFKAGQLPRQDVLVINTGKTTVYVTATARLITHPGTKREKAVHIPNPAKMGLLVTPNKLVIPANQRREVRFMLTKKPGAEDRIYRVTIAPVAGSLIPTSIQTKKDKIGIHILVAYDVLAMVRAAVGKPELKESRVGKKLIVTNTGNTNVLVSGGKQCFEKKCVSIKPRRLYAGNTWTLKLKYNTPVVLNTDYLGFIKKIKTD